ncbi:carboxypeptidase regulatory-like domain-containing protein [Rhodohalobacter sp. SW132]|uniref:MSCRAMM family protein n=1 Tax=Rhodohalobacter sp. SW132 TaxID=2293433 RepID=UPI000E2640E6|nr:carboxypeptidase regulatory-like domain-containing protein [Rhodohalobacter sp. SW132]REL33800.1 carboxypeptidase regulatory-like domain-containing protein [Rhodohalobacter sp. SW132]
MDNRVQTKNRFDGIFNFLRAGNCVILMFAALVAAFSVGMVACGDDPAPTAPDPGNDIDVIIEGVVIDASGSQIQLEETEKAGQVEVQRSDDPEDFRSGREERKISDERETIPVETDIDDERASLKTEGDPIEGAEVSVYLPGTESPVQTAKTDDDGSYELSFTVAEGEAPNELRLEVEADGFEHYETTLSFRESVSYDIELVSRIKEEGMTLEGQVYGPATGGAKASMAGFSTTDPLSGEAPVAGAEIAVYDASEYPDGADPIATATTDDDGKYEAEDVPVGIDALVIVDSEPRLSAIVHDADEYASGYVNTATTLAAEYWGPDLMMGTLISKEDLQETVEAAMDALENKSADELVAALEALVTENFGDGFPDPVPPHLQYLLSALSGFDLSVCEDIELAEHSARPTNEVDLYGLAEEFGDEPWAWLYDASIESPGNEDRHLVYVERTAGDAAVLVVPLHPGNVMDGGPGEIAFFDENEEFVCPGREFNVEPLEPAQGLFAGLIDELEEFLEGETDRIGYDPEELRHINISELNDEQVLLAPLAAGFQMIDSPNYPNNLRNRLSGDAPRLEGESLDDALELVNALAAEAGYTSLMDNLQNGNEAALVTQAEMEPHMPECLELPWNISTPDQLDCWMGALEVFDRLRETIRTVRAPQDKIIGLIASYGPEDPGAFDPVSQLAEAAAMSESMMEALRMYADLMYHLLPAELTHLEIEADPALYKEDDEQAGGWQGVLSAKSQDYTFNFIMAMEPIPQLGAGNVTNMLARKSGRSELAQELIGEITDILVDEMEDLDIVERDFDARPYEVDHNPKRSDPDEKEYFEWELRIEETETGEPSIVFTDDERGYLANAVGVSELRVRTKGGDVFLGQDAVNNTFIEVQKIDVTITGPGGGTSPFIVEPGQEIDLFAEVENAIDKTVEWSADDGFFINIEGEFDQDVTYAAPMEQGSNIVRATSTAETGARADGEPPRIGRATVVVGDFNVAPDPVCLGLEETINFSATFAGDEVPFDQVNYTFIEGSGSLSSEGEFAPGGPGDIAIEFEYFPPEFDDPLIDEISFTVVDEPICSYIEVVTDNHHLIGECVVGFGDDDGVGILNDGQSYQVIYPTPLDDFLVGVSVDLEGFSHEGEYNIVVKNYSEPSQLPPYNRYISNFGVKFTTDPHPLPDLNLNAVSWGAPTWDPDNLPVGGQVLSLRRDIIEVVGEEIAVFSGEAFSLTFSDGPGALRPGDASITGSIRFGGVIDMFHDPAPSTKHLCGYWKESDHPPTEWPDF